jgi:hypothetical protein
MSLITFISAKGSPGVSTAVTTLASLWPRPVVAADLDIVGGDIALRHRTGDGSPLQENRGLMSLGAALRSGDQSDLDDHLQATEDGLLVLTGVSTPGQTRGLGTAWPHIGAALRAHDADVLVDGGRFVPGSPLTPVMECSSALVFVARADLEGLAHLRTRLSALQESIRIGSMEGTRIGYTLVGDPGDVRGTTDTERLLASAGISASLLGVIGHDPRAVAGLQVDSPRRLRRSLYIRSLIDVAERIRTFAGVRVDSQEAVTR